MQEKKNLTLYKITFLLHVELILGSNQVSCSYKKEATHTSQQEDWLVFLSSVDAELLNLIYLAKMMIMCNVPCTSASTKHKRHQGVTRE